MTTSTFRADAVAGLKAVIDAYLAANPSSLVATFDYRPESFALTPLAFVDTRNETVVHDAGTRTRTMTPVVVVVDRITTNTETMARLDALVDGLLDQFTATNPLVAGGNWRGSVSISDSFEQVGDNYYQAVTFSFGDVLISEGRS